MEDPLVVVLSLVELHLNRFVPIIEIVLGTIGNILNVFIFRTRSLRSNSCSFYFFAQSINNLFVLYLSLLTRLLSSGWNYDFFNYSDFLCKFRLFLTYALFCSIQWFIVLTSIDRYLSSSPELQHRQLTTVSIAKRNTILLVIIVFLCHGHIFIWWSIRSINGRSICNVFNRPYDIFFSIFFVISTCLLPLILMTYFGLKTIFNVRQVRHKVFPNDQQNRVQHMLNSKDRQLIRMLLIQVFSTIIFSAPLTIINIYSTINDNLEITTMSPRDNAIYLFLGSLCRLLSYLNPVIGFYIFTLTSRTFRHELKSVVLRFFRCCPRRTG